MLKCAERAESTPKGKHTHTVGIVSVLSIHATVFLIHVFPANGVYSVTVLMSAAASAPPAPERFECLPLEKFGHEPFFTWRFSNPPVPLRAGRDDSLPVSILCGASFKVGGFGANVCDD